MFEKIIKFCSSHLCELAINYSLHYHVFLPLTALSRIEWMTMSRDLASELHLLHCLKWLGAPAPNLRGRANSIFPTPTLARMRARARAVLVGRGNRRGRGRNLKHIDHDSSPPRTEGVASDSLAPKPLSVLYGYDTAVEAESQAKHGHLVSCG